MTIKTQHPKTLAATRRAILSRAFEAWMPTDPETAEADLALEAALLETQTITEEDTLDEISVTDDGDEIRIVLNGGDEILTIDIHGNTTRGAAE